MPEYCADGPELDLVTFTEVGGAAVHYSRPPVAEYGCLGVPRKYTRLDREFLAKLDKCLLELWEFCPAGKALAIVQGGCYVDKPGMHSTGRAIDIDALWWPPEASYPPIITLRYPKDRKRYLAVEAILRKHFGIVLDYHYNKKHRGHWHVDDSQPVGFFATGSRVVFIQAALIYVFSIEVEHNGKWSEETQEAVASVTAQLDTPDDATTMEGWLGFLDAVALSGFGNVEATTRPSSRSAPPV